MFCCGTLKYRKTTMKKASKKTAGASGKISPAEQGRRLGTRLGKKAIREHQARKNAQTVLYTASGAKLTQTDKDGNKSPRKPTRVILGELQQDTLITLAEWLLKERRSAAEVTLVKLLLGVPVEVRFYPFDWGECIPIKNMLALMPELEKRFKPSTFEDHVWRLLAENWGIILAEPTNTKKRLIVEDCLIRGQELNKKSRKCRG